MEAVDVREVLRKRIPHLRAYLRILTGDEKLADSIALTALERTIQKGTAPDAEQVVFDLFVEARRECRARVPELAESPKRGRPCASQRTPTRLGCEEGDRLLAELRRLPPEMREPIILRYGAGFDFKTTFRIVGGQEGTFKCRLHRGFKQLRTALEVDEIAADDEEREAA